MVAELLDIAFDCRFEWQKESLALTRDFGSLLVTLTLVVGARFRSRARFAGALSRRICGFHHDYTEKYLARGFSTTIALVLCSGCSCHSSLIETPIRSAPSRRSSGTWSSSFGHAG